MERNHLVVPTTQARPRHLRRACSRGPLFLLPLPCGSGRSARRDGFPVTRKPSSMKIALVAQHATPAPGDSAKQAGDDARLVEMSRSLAGNGHQVTVYARRGSAGRPDRARLAPGVSVEYVGPADSVADAGRSDDAHLLAQVAAFSQPLHERWSKDRPDVVHALRWTSGLAALSAARDLSVPVVQTFDSLGVAERRHRMIP